MYRQITREDLFDQWGYKLCEKKMEKFEMDNLMLEDAIRFAVDMHQSKIHGKDSLVKSWNFSYTEKNIYPQN